MAKWLTVQRFRTIGDKIPMAGYILDLSYFVVKRKDLERLGLLEALDPTDNHQGHSDCVNIHFMSGYSSGLRKTAKQARYNVIKTVSDEFEKSFGVRLWVERDIDDTFFG